MVEKYEISRHFYRTLYNSVGDNFFKLVSLLDFQNIEVVNKEVRFNGWVLIADIREYCGGFKLLRSVDFFYYQNRGFQLKKRLFMHQMEKHLISLLNQRRSHLNVSMKCIDEAILTA